MELTPQQKRKVGKLIKLSKEGNVAITAHLFELEEKIDEEIPHIKNIISKVKGATGKVILELPDGDIIEKEEGTIFVKGIKGDDGYTPKKGVDYVDGSDYKLTAKDKKDIAESIKVPIVEKIVTHETIIKEQPIVTNEIKEVAVSDEPSEIVEKLQSLKDDNRLDASAIKNLPESSKSPNGGGWRNLFQLHDVELSSPTDNQVLTYDSTTSTWKNETPAGGTIGPGTINEIAYFDTANTIASLSVATYPSLTELSYVKGVTSAIQTQINTKANSSGALTQFVGNNTWKVWYSDGSGDVQELALGADGTFLKSNGAAIAPSFATPAGSGDVSKVGTPVNNQVGVWTGDGTLEGDTALTFDTATDTLTTGILNSTSLTASEIVITDGSKNLVSAAVATYPSLTELTYLKGVTSAIQTQINAKGSGTVTAVSSANADISVATGTTTPVLTLNSATAATASTIVKRDANANISVNNYFANTASTVSAGGTTVLTAASARTQNLTGASNQTFQLPDATTLSLSSIFEFNNNSSGSLTVTNAGAVSQYVVPAGGAVMCYCTSIGTANGTWDFHALAPLATTWSSGITGLVMNSALTTSPRIGSGASSSTAPSFIPQRGASTTGFGGDGTDLFATIAGTARLTISATGITATNLSGTNTGDQTSIVGITGTTAQFNTALSDGDFATGGGTVTGTSSGTNTGDQTITNTSDATSHTVTLSASGGSIQFIEGTNISLATGGTAGAGTLTITASGGSGDVTKVGTPADNQIGVWTGDGTIEGTTGLTYDGTNILANAELLQMTSTNVGALGPYIYLYHNSATPAANDVVGEIDFVGEDSGGGTNNYARIKGVIVDTTATSEDGKLVFRTITAGTEADRVEVTGTATAGIVQSAGNTDLQLQTGNATTGTITIIDGADGTITIAPNGAGTTKVDGTLSPVTTDDGSLGTSALMWSDLFLASGSVINWNNGDVTLTHAADVLTLAGGGLDAGGATSLEIPNGAGGTTVDAAGEICVDTTSKTVNFYDGAAEKVLTPVMSKAITIESPTATEDVSMFYTDDAITITKIVAVLVGSATPSVTWTVRHGTDRSAAGAEVVTSGTTTTSTTTGSVVTSFNDATVIADSFLWIETTAQSGTVGQINITVFYTQDA